MKSLLIHYLNKIFNILGFQLVHCLPERPVYKVDRIIDVGVAYGTNHLLSDYSDCSYVYVEANPKFYDFIENNLLSRTDGTLLKYGAGSEEGTLTFYQNSLASGFLPRKDKVESLECQKIKVRRLDDLLEEINFFDSNSKSLLKIDTEGFELEVLKGSEKLLSSDCLKYIQLEVRIDFIDTYNPSDIFVKLQKYGFVFSRVDKVAFRKKGISYIDITFEKPEI